MSKIKQHCYEIETSERIIVHWTKKQLELADYLRIMGAICYIEGLGWAYRHRDLKEALTSLRKGKRRQ